MFVLNPTIFCQVIPVCNGFIKILHLPFTQSHCDGIFILFCSVFIIYLEILFSICKQQIAQCGGSCFMKYQLQKKSMFRHLNFAIRCVLSSTHSSSFSFFSFCNFLFFLSFAFLFHPKKSRKPKKYFPGTCITVRLCGHLGFRLSR